MFLDSNVCFLPSISGPYLTDVNLGKRKIGVNFLSIFLSNLSEDFLNEDECRLFAKFYQDRINDHHSLIPSIIKGKEQIYESCFHEFKVLQLKCIF